MKQLFSLLLLLCSLSLAARQQGVFTLHKDSLSAELYRQWRYHGGDDPNWALPAYDDHDWLLTDARMQSSRDSTGFSGIGWFRLHLYVDSTLAGEQLALQILQSGASEIYVDGKQIETYGTIGKDEQSSKYYNPQIVPLSVVFDTVGEHLIAVRYANYGATQIKKDYADAKIGFTMSIDKAINAIETYGGRLIAIGGIMMPLCGFFLALAFLHFILWLYRRNDKSDLFFSLFSFSLFVSFLLPYLLYTVTNPDIEIWGNYLKMIAIVLIFVSLSGLSNELFSKKKTRFYIITALGIVPLLLMSSYVSWAMIILFVLLAIVILESIILTIIAIFRKQRGARIVGVGVLYFTMYLLVMLVLSLLKKDLTIGTGNAKSIFLSIYTATAILSIPISMSVFLAWSFATMYRNLNKQLEQVQLLSEKNLAQEQEKKRILETQNERLEHEVAERTREITAEKHKSDELLRNILPEEVAEELKQKGSSEARYFDHVTVIFTDFVDFTKAGERMSPQELVDELDTCFKEFDKIISKHHIEKIKTIGDAYLAVCGLPVADGEHALKTVHAALEILHFMQERKRQLPDKTFDIRIGIHSGAVVAGIVGVKKFAYDIWGDTVNTAARMESASQPDKINISAATYELVKERFVCTYRGEIAAKNKGDMDMYFVERAQ